MGYTVYFEQTKDFATDEWHFITHAVSRMFRRLKQIKGGDGTGRPIVNDSDIVFNGDASKGEDHETFQLSKCNSGFQFCKTARKSYDRYVKAVLVIANYYAPGVLNVSCDGDDEPGCWDEGVRLANIYLEVSGRSACSPLEIKRLKELQARSDPYAGVYPELDDTIKRLEELGTFANNKPMQFLVNYLKSHMNDIKDTYTP